MGEAKGGPVGFVGLGKMGFGMARALLRKGYPLVVLQRNKRAAELAGQGAEVAEGLAGMAPCRAALTSLPGPAEVREVVLGPGGLADHLRPGSVVIDTSTSGLPLARELAERLAERGILSVDAPVHGGPDAAEAGTLHVLAGGETEAVEAARDILEALGERVHRAGGPGMGQLAKVLCNTLNHTQYVALCEGLVLAAKAGIDPELFFQVLASGSGDSQILRYRVPRILEGDFRPRVRLDILYKDLELGLEQARLLAFPLLLPALAQQVVQRGRAAGLGEMDPTSLITVLEKEVGVLVRKRAHRGEA